MPGFFVQVSSVAEFIEIWQLVWRQQTRRMAAAILDLEQTRLAQTKPNMMFPRQGMKSLGRQALGPALKVFLVLEKAPLVMSPQGLGLWSQVLRLSEVELEFPSFLEPWEWIEWVDDLLIQ